MNDGGILKAWAVVSNDVTTIHKNGTTMMMAPMMSTRWSSAVEANSDGFCRAVSAPANSFAALLPAVLLSTASCSICSLLLLHKLSYTSVVLHVVVDPSSLQTKLNPGHRQ